MFCRCQIIPDAILERLARDSRLSAEQRKNFADTALIDAQIRQLRVQAGKLTAVALSLRQVAAVAAAAPAITVADCHHGQSLPGTPVPNPERSVDGTVKRAAVETKAVADFFRSVFGRNSIDNAGMTMSSSVHYGANYNNAFWNGSRMTYGDGDGNIFIDFTKSTDVIAHELTHGVTQFSLQLAYTNQAGGLNESVSDVFGSMFRQWRAGHDIKQADWLIGNDIMGPGAVARGFTCLRDMSDPGAKHCLAPQPSRFADFAPGMDPHLSSGIPNLAFCLAAKAIGGKSWEKAGQIWYKALTGFPPRPSMTMKSFAKRTRQLATQMYPGDAAVAHAVDAGWTAVGL
ncbi:MAG: M4 family metallopeptidase [Geminicoccaceae bacterium]